MKKKKFNVMPWVFNTPYILYSMIFLFLPLIWAFWLSMTDWNLMSPNYNFVKLQNFAELFTDKKVTAAFWNTLRYLVPIVILCFILGVGIALMVSKLPSRLKGFAAVMFFIPYLTSGVSTSVMVKYLFSYNSALSTFLREKLNLNVNWLQSEWAFYILVIMIVWKMAGYYALFVLSGIESISEDVYEAGMLDGCVGIKKLFYITLPMITPTLTSVIVLAAGLSFQIFSEPFLLTGGGPLMSTTTWQLEIYNASFVRFRSGYGAAMAIACAIQTFVVIQLITWIMNKINRKFGW
ncbi:MAG: sugar ABC transporter permease [Lachnospiraceae bacterium]|nr:sugar ABC transporter permease [Lachnospiraceae bacterium]